MAILRKVIYGLLMVVVLIGVIYWALPKGPRNLMEFEDPKGQDRPMVRANQHAVVAGTPWAAEVAYRILEEGGNAFDAAIAGLLVLYVTHGEASGFPGIAPAMIYDAQMDTVRGYIGVGTAPAKATIEVFRKKNFETIPKMHLWSQLVPAGPDVIVALLQEYGSMSFQQLVEPAIKLANLGFPVHKVMAHNLQLGFWERLGYSFLMPYNARVYLEGEFWRPIHLKDRFRRPDLAHTFEQLTIIEAEALQRGKSRKDALQEVRAFFYRGPIASDIAKFHSTHGGLIAEKDLQQYNGRWEEPIFAQFEDYSLFVNGTWSQGICMPMILQILAGYDLKSLGHNSAEYIHLLVQAIELAMADREAYVGDSDFVEVPVKELLSPTFAMQRKASLSEKAFEEAPPPGVVPGSLPWMGSARGFKMKPGNGDSGVKFGDDTSQIVVIDSSGNVVAITPSDFPMTPMIDPWDLTMGNRMTQFRLDPAHPAALKPGKRPRVTPQAIIIFRDHQFYMAINTPGGDNQIQAMVQVFLNHAIFGMDIQEAISAPRFQTYGFPNSFAPHHCEMRKLAVEEGISIATRNELEKLNYQLVMQPKWGIEAGVGAIVKHGGMILAGSDPRAETIAKGR